MKRRILIVEDNRELAEFYTEVLSNEGFETKIVGTKETALAEVSGQKADLVLLDLILDEGSGKEILKEIRQVSKVPVIVITNLPYEKENCVKLGANDFLVKSETEPEEIVEKVRSLTKA